MMDLLKEVIGIPLNTTDYDLFLVIICAIGAIWITKQVISAVYNAVLHIFM